MPDKVTVGTAGAMGAVGAVGLPDLLGLLASHAFEDTISKHPKTTDTDIMRDFTGRLWNLVITDAPVAS